MLTGVFAHPAINSLATEGLAFGGTRQFAAQAISIIITIAFAAIGTVVCASLTKLFGPLRVSKREELTGLDLSEHGEIAYPSFTGLD
ncbi:ammonia channel protein AmtB [Elusimicrobium posterum]